jgi:hypothetical protein
MTGVFQFAEVMFNIDTAYIMAYSKSANTYSGTAPEELASPQEITFEPDMSTDILMGAGINQEALAVMKGAKMHVKAGGFDRSVYAVMSGNTDTVTSTTPTQVSVIKELAGGGGMGYFGLIAVGRTTNGGTLVCGVQCCQLSSPPKISLMGEDVKFSQWECDGAALPVVISSFPRLRVVRSYETTGFVAPTNAATFLSYFTA